MLRLTKRAEISKDIRIKVIISAIMVALLLSGIFIAALGYNPFSVFAYILKGAFGSSYRIRQTIIKAIPLLITAIGISVAFKMQFWNIGGEGQILMGAFGAALVGLFVKGLPKPILLMAMCLSAMIIAGLYALISGALKVYFNANETIVTLMFNYIALKFITFLQYGPWRDKKAMNFPKIASFPKNAILPKVLNIHIGWIIAIIVVIVFYLFMKKSKMGYEISVLGESHNTARYAGININKTILKAVFISGMLCGLTGFIQASAVSQTLSTEVAGGVGYTAIIIAWLSNLNAPIAMVVSFLFAGLLEGGAYIQTAFGISSSASSIIQALILFCVLGSDFFLKYKISIKSKEVA